MRNRKRATQHLLRESATGANRMKTKEKKSGRKIHREMGIEIEYHAQIIHNNKI